MFLTKKRKKALDVLPRTPEKQEFKEAFVLLKKITYTSFDSSVDLAIRLGIDVRKTDQLVRGRVSLPHGLGKSVKILVLCEEDKREEAKKAGADYVGLEDYLEKIGKGWYAIDVIVAQPSVMPRMGKLGRVLGPRGLMPNPKTGTVSDNIAQVVSEIKAGKVDVRADKFGIVHLSIGRVSFSADALAENAKEVVHVLGRLRPSASKGVYFRSAFVSTTMSPSIALDESRW